MADQGQNSPFRAAGCPVLLRVHLECAPDGGQVLNETHSPLDDRFTSDLERKNYALAQQTSAKAPFDLVGFHTRPCTYFLLCDFHRFGWFLARLRFIASWSRRLLHAL